MSKTEGVGPGTGVRGPPLCSPCLCHEGHQELGLWDPGRLLGCGSGLQGGQHRVKAVWGGDNGLSSAWYGVTED